VALADSIVVEKRARRLTLFHLGRPIRTYLVALGGNPVGDKVSAGDRRTPEGLFSIQARNPASSFHLSLRISYPDVAHRTRAEALGVSPGGDIMIHGLPNGQGSVGAYHRTADWTNGCVALTNEEIEEIWSAVPIGTPVQIKP
jgi:murein L,D-transpeptidase YafK